MAKNESLNLGYLGYSFQVKLVKQLVEDHKFSESIVSIVDPNYFDNEYMRLIVASLKDYYEKYETIPSYETIFNIIKSEVRREIENPQLNLLRKLENLTIKTVYIHKMLPLSSANNKNLRRLLRKSKKF